jgi:hypothetical protein
MVLTNYRGIAHRAIEFPERGVVVVSGANEIGKSSMIEALDLLLEAKDRSTKREVKQVKPTHADVGADVTAEISTGPYRFVYRKRFHKQPLTELTVLAPRRAQLTGDEAHERVLAILEETVDMELWRAQRVLQSASTAPVDLSGSDALSRALDVAAGQAVALSGTEPLLVDQIDVEYRQYFTATGRPTAEWLAATKRLAQATDELTRCAAAVAEVDAAVVQHGELTERLARLSLDRAAALRRLELARTAAGAVATLTERVGQARTLAEAVAAARAASVAAVEQRTALVADVDVRTKAIAELDAAVQHAVAEQVSSRAAANAAAAAAGAARAASEQGDSRVQAARAAVDAIARRQEAERLAGRVAKIDAARSHLRDREAVLASITVSAAVIKAVETADAAVERARMQAQLASARMEVTAASDVAVVIAGEPVELVAGSTHFVVAGTTTAVEVPGVLTVRVVPGEPAADSQALLDAARRHLASLLDGAGVSDVAAARAEDERRRELTADRDRLRATCAALLGDDDVEALRAGLAKLRADLPAECEGDADAARAELGSAVATHRQSVDRSDALRGAAELAAAKAAERTTAATVLTAKLASVRAELATTTEKLARQRDSITDDQLAATADADAGRVLDTATRAEILAAELVALAPDAVAAELEEAGRLADAAAERHDEVGEHLRDLAAQLKVYGSEGRKGRLDAAEAEREHAQTEHERLRRRSGAADLLRSVMSRHRDAARQRYVDPFRREVERLGRIVFGADFEVEIDGDLRICSRTLAGVTVAYESLSGGAKEQLGIIARLASAALVAKEDGVPVVIDDALGFTDADRLTRMGEVFDAVGGDGQVIILTCSPDRYTSAGDVRHVELTASSGTRLLDSRE